VHAALYIGLLGQTYLFAQMSHLNAPYHGLLKIVTMGQVINKSRSNKSVTSCITFYSACSTVAGICADSIWGPSPPMAKKLWGHAPKSPHTGFCFLKQQSESIFALASYRRCTQSKLRMCHASDKRCTDFTPDKKAELSQRRPRDAPYVWAP